LIIVKVATTNPVKIEAIKKVFSFYFEELYYIKLGGKNGRY